MQTCPERAMVVASPASLSSVRTCSGCRRFLEVLKRGYASCSRAAQRAQFSGFEIVGLRSFRSNVCERTGLFIARALHGAGSVILFRGTGDSVDFISSPFMFIPCSLFFFIRLCSVRVRLYCACWN